MNEKIPAKGEEVRGMIGFLKRCVATVTKEKPVMRVLIQKCDVQTAKWIVAEMNKEYGESHTLCIEVRF